MLTRCKAIVVDIHFKKQYNSGNMEISDKNRLHKYFKASSAADEDFVAELYLDNYKEFDLREIAREHWDESPSSEIELQHILNQIHFHINTNSNKPLIRTRILAAYYRVAAILLIPLLIGAIYQTAQNFNKNETYAEIFAPQGSRVQFSLPDGTKGHLNGGSRLQYPVNFIDEREINLSGEVYLEVAKNEKRPFVVKTKHVDVTVLGTRFDVCAYEADQEVHTTLEEGSVRIFNKAAKTYDMLNPGEQNIVNTSNGKMKNVKVNTKLYTSWKEEMLRFDNSPFDEVVKKMERWYGVTITLDKSLKYSEYYTFTVKTESLRELLDLLSITTPMSYKIENNTVMIYPLKRKY